MKYKTLGSTGLKVSVIGLGTWKFGGELVEKEVEKILKWGNNTASVLVKAEVCSHCGERLFSEETVRRFKEIRKKL